MTFVLSEDQALLARTARQFVADRSPVARLRKLRDDRDDVGFSRELWRELGDLGFLGVAIPEAYGGSGLGFFDLCSLLDAKPRFKGRRIDRDNF